MSWVCPSCVTGWPECGSVAAPDSRPESGVAEVDNLREAITEMKCECAGKHLTCFDSLLARAEAAEQALREIAAREGYDGGHRLARAALTRSGGEEE